MRFGRVIFGLVVVLIGAALMLGKLDVAGTDIPGDYWPVILIAVGFIGWVSKGFLPSFGSLMLMTLGGILLTQNLVDDKSFVDLWPALAIAIGVSIIFGGRHRKGRKHGFGMKFKGRGSRWNERCKTGPSNDSDAFFSGGGREIEGEYTGSRPRVKLASDGIDLTGATLPEDGATLNLDIMLGEYKIRIPNDWKLDIKAEVTLGQIEVNRPDVDGERTGPTLTIDGKLFMGGVEVTG